MGTLHYLAARTQLSDETIEALRVLHHDACDGRLRSVAIVWTTRDDEGDEHHGRLYEGDSNELRSGIESVYSVLDEGEDDEPETQRVLERVK